VSSEKSLSVVVLAALQKNEAKGNEIGYELFGLSGNRTIDDMYKIIH